jgi:hypothetical protein
VPAQAGRAKALAAAGQTQAALDSYAEIVDRVPDPLYVIPYGRLLESQGRTGEAEEQYRVAGVAWKLHETNGVEPDADQILIVADEGDPQEALRMAETAVPVRPFLAVQDAYAWALHRNGRYDDAERAVQAARQLGTRDAQFHFLPLRGGTPLEFAPLPPACRMSYDAHSQRGRPPRGRGLAHGASSVRGVGRT